MNLKIISNSVKETQKIAYLLGKELLKEKNKKHALIMALEGNLGAGKTTFLQGLAKGLKVKGRIFSPTFILMRPHEFGKKRGCFFHIDAYRLKHKEDLLGIDFGEIIKEQENVIVIEWPGRVKSLLPKNTIWIKFKILGKLKREIRINPK